MNPRISVVIPTLDRRNKLQNCVESVLGSDYDNIELIVIDNGSTDGTINYLKELEDDNVRVIYNGQNLGLAQARNQGIMNSSGKFLLFIDDDNVIEMSMITILLQFFSEHHSAGIVAPKTLYRKEPDKIWFYGADINLLTSKVNFTNRNTIGSQKISYNLEVNCVHNCFMVKKEVLDSIGLFDGQLFLSYTEFDLCMRARPDYKTYLCGAAECYHDRLPTDKKNSVESYGFTNQYRVYFLIRNRGIIIKRYANFFQLAIFSLVFYPMFFLYNAFILVKYHRLDYLKHHIRGFLSGVGYITTNRSEEIRVGSNPRMHR